MTRGILWTIGGVLVGLVLAIALIALARLRGSSRIGSSPPALTIIPLPTATVPIISSPSPQAEPTSTSTPSPDAPKQFDFGELVEVAGTGGNGLRIRESPSLDARVLHLGLESEVFEVTEGPIAAEGYSWWHLVNPFDPTKGGWAVDQFLRSIENSQ